MTAAIWIQLGIGVASAVVAGAVGVYAARQTATAAIAAARQAAQAETDAAAQAAQSAADVARSQMLRWIADRLAEDDPERIETIAAVWLEDVVNSAEASPEQVRWARAMAEKILVSGEDRLGADDVDPEDPR